MKAKKNIAVSDDKTAHFNAPKLRIDTWNQLAALASEILYSTEHNKLKKFESEISRHLKILSSIEAYYAYPGIELCIKISETFYKCEFKRFHDIISAIVQSFHFNKAKYKYLLKALKTGEVELAQLLENENHQVATSHYFEVLIVDDLTMAQKEMLRTELQSYSAPDEKFVYELVFVNSFEDAVIAVMFNFNIKCCLISDFFKHSSHENLAVFQSIIQQANMLSGANQPHNGQGQAVELASVIRSLRANEIDLYYLASHDPEKFAATEKNKFNKIFYNFENFFELHLTFLQDIQSHYETPFFDSLKKYTFEPKSSFHGLPLARGKSVFNSECLRDMRSFYGSNIFLAESTATSGGLDSLMNPVGSIKRAMQKASSFFGSNETFFVTNGTSAANKIVLQALLKPDEIVLIEHTCHESHDYGVILTGAYPLYLNGYHVEHCDIAGPVPIRSIKAQLLQLKKKNLLEKVKLLVLTNCTFDGLVYHVQNFMEEVLAIKPDMIFLWDEAWFAFARCVPHYRQRTAMYAAAQLEKKYKTAAYREEYLQFKKALDEHADDENYWLNTHLLPNPDAVKMVVYSTQSTHKSLSSFRQGSMIHVYDAHFDKNREKFTHAFVTHSTTSPNYQILASLDLARRQADIEGFELVQNAIELAMIFRTQVNRHTLINRFFQALGPTDMIPEEFRYSQVKSGYEPARDWTTVARAWMGDDFVLDPTRVTLKIKNSCTGYAMQKILMNRFGIQVNKVSLKSILIQFNIGTLRSSVSYLLDALFTISSEFELLPQVDESKKIVPLLPEFTEFSAQYKLFPGLAPGKLRQAYYDGQDENAVEFVEVYELIRQIKAGRQPVSASILIPVPPGYPALLPGQIITESILQFLIAIDLNTVICGYNLASGFKVFKE